MAGTRQCSWLCQIRQRANEPTSQRANDVQPYRTYRDFLSPWMMGPWAISIEDTNDSRPVLHPGIECVLCGCRSASHATSTVHSPRLKPTQSQGGEISTPESGCSHFLRAHEHGHEHSPNIAPESPWPLAHRAAGTKHQTPCSESHSQLSSRKSDTTPRCSHTQRKFVLPHPQMYRLSSRSEFEAELARPVYGDRCTGEPSILLLR